jgi:uncharacterized protein YggE
VSDDNDRTKNHDGGHHDHAGDPRGRQGRRAPLRFVFLIVFAIVIAAIAFTGETLGHSRTSSASTITVTGSGTVRGTPNTMSFEIGVQTTASSATSALDQNNREMKKLEASLLAHGLTKANLQTSGLNIWENTNSSGQVTGFTVSDDLNAVTHKLSEAGAALDAAAHAVGNGIQLDGVSFSISNQSKLLASARARAIENAHTEAAQIAKGAGATIGQVIKVTDEENTGSTGIVYPVENFARAAAAVPIETGSQSLNVQVEVVYALNG